MSSSAAAFSSFSSLIHQTPISTDIALETLNKSLNYWINKRSTKKLNVLDLGSCDGSTVYSLWNRAIKNFKSLEKIHIYVSNIVEKEKSYDDALVVLSKTRPDLDRRIVIHPIASSTLFRDYKTTYFKDFKMNIVTCWLDSRVSWSDPVSTQRFFSILQQGEFLRPGGLFLYLNLDGSKLLSTFQSTSEEDVNMYSWPHKQLCFVTSKLMFQNMCCAYIRHPWEMFLYMYLENVADPYVISTASFEFGMIDAVAGKYGFQSVFRENVAKFCKHVFLKKTVHLQDRWWNEDENWEFSKCFLVGAYVFNPEDESYSFDAHQVFYN
jgi:hypothetical protein